MMRVSPLGIFGENHALEQVAEWSQHDAALTHPHAICLQANALFVTAIACGVKTGIGASDLYEQIVVWVEEMEVDLTLREAVAGAAGVPPDDHVRH